MVFCAYQGSYFGYRSMDVLVGSSGPLQGIFTQNALKFPTSRPNPCDQGFGLPHPREPPFFFFFYYFFSFLSGARVVRRVVVLRSVLSIVLSYSLIAVSFDHAFRLSLSSYSFSIAVPPCRGTFSFKKRKSTQKENRAGWIIGEECSGIEVPLGDRLSPHTLSIIQTARTSD